MLSPDLATGPYHRVLNPIMADGYMLHFTVESTFGSFEVTGLGALRKLVRELSAIAELKKIKNTEAWGKQVKNSATGSLQFVGKMITSPVDTVSGLPKGVYKGVENAKTAATTSKDPSQDSTAKTVLLQSGLDIRSVITHRFAYREFEEAFNVMRSGNSGKVILSWEELIG